MAVLQQSLHRLKGKFTDFSPIYFHIHFALKGQSVFQILLFIIQPLGTLQTFGKNVAKLVNDMFQENLTTLSYRTMT